MYEVSHQIRFSANPYEGTPVASLPGGLFKTREEVTGKLLEGEKCVSTRWNQCSIDGALWRP